MKWKYANTCIGYCMDVLCMHKQDTNKLFLSQCKKKTGRQLKKFVIQLFEFLQKSYHSQYRSHCLATLEKWSSLRLKSISLQSLDSSWLHYLQNRERIESISLQSQDSSLPHYLQNKHKNILMHLCQFDHENRYQLKPRIFIIRGDLGNQKVFMKITNAPKNLILLKFPLGQYKPYSILYLTIQILVKRQKNIYLFTMHLKPYVMVTAYESQIVFIYIYFFFLVLSFIAK